jgi:hypothetical protein
MLNKLENIEKIELDYLRKYYHFFRYIEQDLLKGFDSKEKIRQDWKKYYDSGISEFAIGAERIIYSLLNGKSIHAEANSSPVGSDFIFEFDDAFVHLDIKTVGATSNPSQDKSNRNSNSNNIGDYATSIFVGENQNSYYSEIKQAKSGKPYRPPRFSKPSLPTYYNKNKPNEKICLTYFFSILYDKDTLKVLVMTLLSMPNGELMKHYKERVLKAGKNPPKVRFNFKEVNKFELLKNYPSRVKVVYFNKGMNLVFKKSLKFIESVYDEQEQ